MAVMLFRSHAEQAILESLKNASVKALASYRSEMDRRMDMYVGDQENHTVAAMAEVFPETYNQMRPENFWRFTRKIVDDKSQVYWQRPERKLRTVGGDELDSEDQTQAEWERLVSVGKLDTVCRVINRRAELLWTMALWVQHDARRDAIRWMPVLPQCIYVIENPDEPGDIQRAELVIIPLDSRTATAEPGRADRKAWIAWNRDEVIKFYGDVSDERIQVEEVFEGYPQANPTAIGKERINPLVLAHSEHSSGAMFLGFDGSRVSPSSVIEANVQVNLALTDMAYLIRMQAYGQGVWNSATKPPAKNIVGPGAVLWNKDTTGGGLSYVQPGAQIAEVRETLIQLMKNHALLEGLAPGSLSTERQDLSGYAMMLENLNLVRYTAEQQEHYAESFERDLFEVTRAVNNAHRSKKIADTLEQDVHFVSLEYPGDPAQQWTADSGKLDKGILSPIDLIMQEFPDLDRAQAEERYQENMEARKARSGAEAIPTPGPKRFFGGPAPKPEAKPVEEPETEEK